MKSIYLLTFFICSIALTGQSRIVSKKVQEINLNNTKAVEFNLFAKNNDFNKNSKYSKAATDVTVLDLNKTELKRIVDESPEFISLEMPYQDKIVDVELYQQNIFVDSFVARDEQGNTIDYNPGKYYRGIVDGDYTSLVAISFFENNVIGVISTSELGNVVLGKSADKQDYVVYSDKNLLIGNSFDCNLDKSNSIQNNLPVFEPSMLSKTQTENCVKIYYELNHEMYLANNSNVNETLDWVTGVHNNVATLYNNDGINIALHSVGIWTSPDPYAPPMDMSAFIESITNMGADIGNIISFRETGAGGIGALDGLCSTGKFTSCSVGIEFENVPIFSDSVFVLAHEMGHVMGSPHTQDCVWNGDNTAIDECGWLEGDVMCGNPGYPENGGTIMSYCSKLPEVGVNFSEGFGPQPAALIRNTIDSKECLDANCSDVYSSCAFTIQGISITTPESGILNVEIFDELSNEWLYQMIPFEELPTENWTLASSSTFTIEESELNQNKYYKLIVKNNCKENVGGGHVSTLFLVGDFCDGTLFTDTGGENGNYEWNQKIIKTFYPTHPEEKVRVDFHRYITVSSKDYIYVYDGNSTASPMFEGGELTGYKTTLTSFTSTDSSGAITVEFISKNNASQGWEATINCAALGLDETEENSQIEIYPNPATTSLNIESESKIKSIQLHDTSGKLILNQKISNLNSASLNIQHLEPSTYMVTINLFNKKIVKKLLKL